MRTIAVGILTYNRVSVCVRNISVLLKNSEELSYNILVVDDGGKGEIEENIKNIKTNKKNLEIISHSKNKGLTESFCDLIENCKTDYLIWLPDDDHLIAESIPKIQSLLSENEPDFVSTVFKRDGKITRGKNENSTIKPKEFWESSFHGTGLIYKVNTLLNYTPLLRAKAKEYNYAAYMYPPEFLIIKLLSSGHKCIWSDIEIAYENNPSPSNLKFIDGRHYKDIESRIKQLESFELLIKESLATGNVKILKQIHKAHQYKVVSTVLEELGSRAPLSLKAFYGISFVYFFKFKLKNNNILKWLRKFY